MRLSPRPAKKLAADATIKNDGAAKQRQRKYGASRTCRCGEWPAHATMVSAAGVSATNSTPPARLK